MLMIIFGAGASYDSIHGTNLRSVRYDHFQPPLAKDLFAPLPVQGEAIDRFPQVRPLIPRLRKGAKEGVFVERELEAIREEAEVISSHHQMLNALRFYLQHVLRECGETWQSYAYGVTNYVELLYRVERWRARTKKAVCIVSFNYDTILEAACTDALRLDLAQVGYYISHDEYKIIKPHGSVHWGVRLNRTTQEQGEAAVRREVIDLGSNLDLSDDFYITADARIVNPHDKETRCPLLPAIAIPMERKSETDFVCPKNHLRALRKCIEEVDHLLIVGWKGYEDHFLRLWENKSPVLQSVKAVLGNQAEASDLLDRLQRPGLVGNGTARLPSETGFSDFLVTDELEQFLGSIA